MVLSLLKKHGTAKVIHKQNHEGTFAYLKGVKAAKSPNSYLRNHLAFVIQLFYKCQKYLRP
jgi:hypothetical protein